MGRCRAREAFWKPPVCRAYPARSLRLPRFTPGCPNARPANPCNLTGWLRRLRGGQGLQHLHRPAAHPGPHVLRCVTYVAGLVGAACPVKAAACIGGTACCCSCWPTCAALRGRAADSEKTITMQDEGRADGLSQEQQLLHVCPSSTPARCYGPPVRCSHAGHARVPHTAHRHRHQRHVRQRGGELSWIGMKGAGLHCCSRGLQTGALWPAVLALLSPRQLPTNLDAAALQARQPSAKPFTTCHNDFRRSRLPSRWCASSLPALPPSARDCAKRGLPGPRFGAVKALERAARLLPCFAPMHDSSRIHVDLLCNILVLVNQLA